MSLNKNPTAFITKASDIIQLEPSSPESPVNTTRIQFTIAVVHRGHPKTAITYLATSMDESNTEQFLKHTRYLLNCNAVHIKNGDIYVMEFERNHYNILKALPLLSGVLL